MRRRFAFLMAALLGAASLPAGAADAVPGGAAMQFPGCGADNPGGRGGRVIKVTTLATAGPGSLRAALDASGPRIIVFEVGGTIDWRHQAVQLQHGQVTLAGETAPAPGITVIRGSLAVAAADVIIRHFSIRLGDGGDLKQDKWEDDSMGAVGPAARRVLFDHCSTSWSIDENLSVSGPRVENGTAAFVTLRNCIVAEGLDESTHPKGPHSKGTLIHDFVHDVAIVGCLYAHNYNRNPMLKPNTRVFMANNLIYDPVSGAIHFAYVPLEYKVIPHAMDPGQLTAVGNVMRLGPYSPPQLQMFSGTPGAPPATGLLYETDSRIYSRKGALLWDGAHGHAYHLLSPQVKRMARPMLWPEGFAPLPGAATEAYVLKNAGSRPRERNGEDRRILADYAARRGAILDSQDEVGGYPHEGPVYRRLAVPAAPAAIEAWLEGYRRQVEF